MRKNGKCSSFHGRRHGFVLFPFLTGPLTLPGLNFCKMGTDHPHLLHRFMSSSETEIKWFGILKKIELCTYGIFLVMVF